MTGSPVDTLSMIARLTSSGAGSARVGGSIEEVDAASDGGVSSDWVERGGRRERSGSQGEAPLSSKNWGDGPTRISQRRDFDIKEPR